MEGTSDHQHSNSDILGQSLWRAARITIKIATLKQLVDTTGGRYSQRLRGLEIDSRRLGWVVTYM